MRTLSHILAFTWPLVVSLHPAQGPGTLFTQTAMVGAFCLLASAVLGCLAFVGAEVRLDIKRYTVHCTVYSARIFKQSIGG